MSTHKQPTKLRSGETTPYLKLDDIKRTSVLQDLSSSFKNFVKKFGLRIERQTVVRFAFASDRGKRDYQEDEVFADSTKSGATIAILTDGMGGHAAGAVASELIKNTVRDHMIAALDKPLDQDQLQIEMRTALDAANDEIKQHSKKNPDTKGMGATMVLAVVQGRTLSWISVGDSLLYLWRTNKCYQLNQDHSMGPAIDQMAKSGIISKEEALVHPDRNVLTSAMNGSTPDLIDAENGPIELMPGDIVVLSSDGLQKIYGEKLTQVLNMAQGSHPMYVTASLLNSVLNLGDTDQDNVSLVTLKVETGKDQAYDDDYADGQIKETSTFEPPVEPDLVGAKD